MTTKSTVPAYKIRTYRIWTYDLWGNAREGYDVNDRYEHGTVSIRCKRTTHNAGTLHEFHQWEPSNVQLARAANVRGAEWEYQDSSAEDCAGDYYATQKSNGKPLCELITARIVLKRA